MSGEVKPYVIKLLVFFSIITLFGGAFAIHLRLDEIQPLHQPMKIYMYIPSGEFLKPFTIGFEQLIADYFWIKTIGYFGEHLMSDRNYPWLYHMLDLVTTLDPHFIWPYYFGGITLSLEAQQVEQSNLILKKAMHYHPAVWKFPFFLGFNYWYYSNDPAKAAYYIKIAAQLPKAPVFLKTFPARLLSTAGQKGAALQFLMEMRSNTQDARMRAQIEKRIQEIRQGTLKAPKKPF
jgi:hypothetical protein